MILYDFLISIGLTPNKTKTIGPLDVPREYFSDFLRGVFDGDGCSFSYFDSIYSRSYRFYIAFASASHALLKWLREEIESAANVSGYIESSSTRSCSQLRYSKHEAIALAKCMYAKPDAPALARKRDKILNSVKIADESIRNVAARRKHARVGKSW